MAAGGVSHQFLQMVQDLINENRRLKGQMGLMSEAYDELEGQRNQLYRLLAKDQMVLASTGKLEPDSSSLMSLSTKDSEESDAGDLWLTKGWLSTSMLRKHLGSVEDLWKSQKRANALKELEDLLLREDISPDIRINAKLLKSCILREGGQAKRALAQANEALDIAKRYDALYDLRGKTRFHLGMCYFEAGSFKEALWSFSLASYTHGHADEVEVWKTLTQEKLAGSSSGSVSLAQGT
ncbi:MAG: hypothetical protein M1822_003347 [Bathelium mastoideum]|nr:MAG: hypothetical protein M1822_003347 [Bathelium mastoideum]